MAVGGRSSGRQQDVAFGRVADELQRAAFNFGAMVASAQQLYSAVRVFSDLNKQLTLTNAIANGTADSFAKMEDATRSFALGVTFTASQSANALLNLSQAGFSVEEGLTAMTGVLTLAQATLEDVNESADLVASTLTSFGLGATEATRVSNLFAASMNQSLASLPKLAFALRQVGPVAGSMGVELESTVAALSELFNVGLRGEQAGTALRNVLVNLISPTGEAAKVIDTLGIRVYKTNGRMRDLFDILRDLANYNLADADMAALFGREALAGGAALLSSAASGSLQQMKTNITGTQEAFRVALEQMTSFDAMAQQARNSVDELRISFGERFAETIKPVLGVVTDMAIAWRGLDEANKSYLLTLGSTTALMAAGVPVAVKLAGALGGVISASAKSVISAASGLQESATWISATANAMRNGNNVRDSLSGIAAAAVAAGPAIGIAAAALAGTAGLAYAFYSARNAYEDAKFSEMFGEITLGADQASRALSNFWQINASGGLTGNLLSGLDEQLDNVNKAIKSQQNQIKTLETQANQLQNAKKSVEEALTFRDIPLEGLTVDTSALSGMGLNDRSWANRLGLVGNEDRDAVKQGIQEYINNLRDQIVSSYRLVDPQTAKKIGDAINSKVETGLDEMVDYVVKLRSPSTAGNKIVEALTSSFSEATGFDNLDSVFERFGERTESLQGDIKKMQDSIGAQMGRVLAQDPQELLENIQKSIVSTAKKPEQAELLKVLKTANAPNEEAIANIRKMLETFANNGDWQAELEALTKTYRDGVMDQSTQVGRTLTGALQEKVRADAVILKEDIEKMRKQQADALTGLATSERKKAAAGGDKAAEKALREAEEQQKLLDKIRKDASELSGLSRPFEGSGIANSPEMMAILTGSWFADAYEAGGSERDRAISSLASQEAYTNELKNRIEQVAQSLSFEDAFSQFGISNEKFDADALTKYLAPLYSAIDSAGIDSQLASQKMQELVGYFEKNTEQARIVVEAAGIPVDTLAAGDVPKVAAGVFFNKWWTQMANALATMDIGGKLSSALKSGIELLANANSGVAGLVAMGNAVISTAAGANFGNLGQGAVDATAEATNRVTSTLEQNATAFDAARQKFAAYQKQFETDISTYNSGIDKRKSGGGSKGKTPQQLQAEIENFLVERNRSIIDANMELAAFGDSFNLDDYLTLSIQSVDLEYTQKITEAKKAYEEMLKSVKSGSADYEKITQLRDNEIAQLEALKARQLEYANSSEYAARVAAESAQTILNKFIELNTYSGTMFQGMAAGAMEFSQSLPTQFQVGMETSKQLIDGFVNFGMDAFGGFFSDVASGNKTMGEVLRESLSKMLMDWANYFAKLALQYAADWVIRQAMGLLNIGMGPGTGSGLKFFPAAPSKLAANGMAYDAAFANGGVTSGSEYFGYRREHKVGKRGEAGEEGILPLARDGQGRLGVIGLSDYSGSSGSSGQSRTGGILSFTNSFQIGIPETQSEEDRVALAELIDQRSTEAALNVVAEQQRAGGLLYNGS